ncbi:hypothetical protein N7453_005938 [Penicillium expansum]|nr:hypothetical protein N7453_005938 [Penicillium expansum]
MASLQFPSLVQTRRSLSPTGPKLRDSCKSCSASKIKCTKEKPQCMRCAKRGMACEYLESKRARRKPGTRPRNRETITMIAHNSPTTTTSSTSPSPCEAERLETRVTTHPSPKTHHPLSFVDILSWTPSLPNPVIATPTGLDYNFDDFLASPISASLLGVPETGDLSAHLMTDFRQLKDFIHAPEVPNLTSSQVAAGEDKTATSERRLPASVPRPQTSTSHLSMSEAPDIGSSCCSISQTLALLTYFPASSSPWRA